MIATTPQWKEWGILRRFIAGWLLINLEAGIVWTISKRVYERDIQEILRK